MRRTFVLALSKGWRVLLQEITNPYRPELHYMRGPGPKYWDKHGRGKQMEASR
jgi:hypothetical protein